MQITYSKSYKLKKHYKNIYAIKKASFNCIKSFNLNKYYYFYLIAILINIKIIKCILYKKVMICFKYQDLDNNNKD